MDELFFIHIVSTTTGTFVFDEPNLRAVNAEAHAIVDIMPHGSGEGRYFSVDFLHSFGAPNGVNTAHLDCRCLDVFKSEAEACIFVRSFVARFNAFDSIKGARTVIRNFINRQNARTVRKYRKFHA